MTRHGLRGALLALLAGLHAGACVFPELGIGDACDAQEDCLSGLACVRLDPEDDDEGDVCLPMLELDAPQACSDDDGCAAAGFPIDATCVDARCTCEGEAFTCDGFDEVVGEHTCRCLPGGLDDGASCEDDNQCISTICGAGACEGGFDGDACDDDDDCPFSATSTCTGGTCA